MRSRREENKRKTHDIKIDLHHPLYPIVQKIRHHAGTTDLHFDHFYQKPITRLLELTNHCSNRELETHLNAVALALKLRRPIILPIGADAEVINEQRDLWTYVVFTASLMYGSSKLIGRKVIIRNDSLQKNDLRWSPFDEFDTSLMSSSDHGDLGLSIGANLVFLSFIFDRACLTWLYRYTDAFNTVLQLASSPLNSTSLGKLILRCHNSNNDNDERPETPQTEFENQLNSIDSREKDTAISATDNSDGSLVEKKIESFRDWIMRHMNSKTTQSIICPTIDGIALADPQAFEQYAKAIRIKNWRHARDQNINSLNLEKIPYPVTFEFNSKRKALLWRK